MLTIHPSHAGSIWHQNIDTGLSVCGHVVDSTGQCFEGKHLLEHLQAHLHRPRDFIQWLQEANGCFAVHWQPAGSHWAMAAVDRIRSFPLFYRDSEVRTQVPLEPTEWNASQVGLFPYACHTLGRYTLHQQWNQLQAGEYLWIENGKIEVKAYFQPINQLSQPPKTDFWGVAEATFQRLISSAEGSYLIVPLSGGYDSRFIAAMLRHLGYERVICFTYGREASYEVQISQKVADRLGYEWHFVPYPDELLEKYLSPAGFGYQDFASGGASLAHEQDWMAVQELRRKELIPADGIFVPGFGGDVLAGSWHPDAILKNSDAVLDYLWASTKFFSGKRVRQLDEIEIKRLIKEEIGLFDISDFTTAYATLQYWGLRNRMSKFLVNAVRVYDHWGYRWRLPFFDRDWMDFWLGVYEGHKVGKGLYLHSLKDRLFKPMGIDFDQPLYGQSSWKKRLKQVIPPAIIDQAKAWFKKPDQLDPTNAERLARLFCRYHGWSERLPKTYSLNFLMATSYLSRHHPGYTPPWKEPSHKRKFHLFI